MFKLDLPHRYTEWHDRAWNYLDFILGPFRFHWFYDWDSWFIYVSWGKWFYRFSPLGCFGGRIDGEE